MNFKFFNYFLFVFFLGIVIRSIFLNLDEILKVHLIINIQNLLGLFLSMVFVYIVNLISWHFVTKSLKMRIKFKDNFIIWMYSNLVRLVPGSIWQYPNKMYLLHKKGANKSDSIKATVVEVLLNLSMGCVTLFASLFFWDLPTYVPINRYILVLFMATSFYALFFYNKLIFRFILPIVSKFKKEKVLEKSINISSVWFFVLSVLFILRFIVSGAALFFVSRFFTPIGFELFPMYLGIFSAAWLLGYISFFSPGGLGVFEVALATLTATLYPSGLVYIIAICYRIGLFLTEAIFLSIAFFLNVRQSKITVDTR